jgi:predicted enzyme related to lactoylglutathione lyase
MPRVAYFEMEADDPKSAAMFFREVFDWGIEKFEGEEEIWFLTTGSDSSPGINGEVIGRKERLGGTCVSIDVTSVSDFEERVKQAGGKVLVPRFPVPEVGYLAYCRDPEGIRFAILESDPSVQE